MLLVYIPESFYFPSHEEIAHASIENGRDVYDKLKWTNLRTKWKINRCLMVHKCLNSNVPEYLCNHFTRSDNKHSTRTSTSGSVNIPALRTVQGQRSFGYTGSKDFNSLPVNLKSIKEYKYFKRETKEHFRNLRV